MVILITGATHCGKTLLAQRLLEKYKYPYWSIDLLKMGLIRSGCTSLSPEEDSELTRYLWPILREIIKTALENQQNLIIEGAYIPSQLISVSIIPPFIPMDKRLRQRPTETNLFLWFSHVSFIY